MPIPDEKARAWTRPEDYWPPRRPRRKSRGKPAISQFAAPRDGSEPAGERRWSLGIVPYALLMLSMAVMAAAVMVLAWPGRTVTKAPVAKAPSEIGTAPKGWIDGN